MITMRLGIGIGAGIRNAVIAAPFVGGLHALFGYTYAKFANMAASQVAIAFSILAMAQSTFATIGISCTRNLSTAKKIQAVSVTGGSLVILAMHKRNLIGQVATIVLISLRVLYCLKLLVFDQQTTENPA